MTEIIPLEDRAVIKMRKLSDKTSGGVLLTDEYMARHETGGLEAEVISVAEFFFKDSSVKPVPGDTVLITKHAGLLYQIDEEEYRVVQPRDIVGIKK